MSSYEDLTNRLLRRYKDVPNVQKEDAQDWIETALNEHGYGKYDQVPSEYASLILLHAEADGASQIAFKTATYFSFVDKDESIDKSMIAGEYRRLARDLWREYHRRKEEKRTLDGGSIMSYMRRVDRP